MPVSGRIFGGGARRIEAFFRFLLEPGGVGAAHGASELAVAPGRGEGCGGTVEVGHHPLRWELARGLGGAGNAECRRAPRQEEEREGKGKRPPHPPSRSRPTSQSTNNQAASRPHPLNGTQSPASGLPHPTTLAADHGKPATGPLTNFGDPKWDSSGNWGHALTLHIQSFPTDMVGSGGPTQPLPPLCPGAMLVVWVRRGAWRESSHALTETRF